MSILFILSTTAISTHAGVRLSMLDSLRSICPAVLVMLELLS